MELFYSQQLHENSPTNMMFDCIHKHYADFVCIYAYSYSNKHNQDVKVYLLDHFRNKASPRRIKS